MIRMIAFDLDGTLADTIPLCIRAFQNSVSPYAGHRLKEEEILRLFGLNEIGMVKAIAGENWQNALKDFYQEYLRLHKSITHPFDGIPELLNCLRKKGVLVALITGKGEESCKITLQMLGLTKYFDEILCGSEKTPVKKECIEYLLDRYALAREEFCYVGDAASDVTVCREAGVVCLTAAWQDSACAEMLSRQSKGPEQVNPGLAFYKVSDLREYIEELLR